MAYLSKRYLANEMQTISEAITAESRRLGYIPTQSANCERLYRFSHRGDVDPTLASELFRSLQYEPYQGFPLRTIYMRAR